MKYANLELMKRRLEFSKTARCEYCDAKLEVNNKTPLTKKFCSKSHKNAMQWELIKLRPGEHAKYIKWNNERQRLRRLNGKQAKSTSGS